MGEGAMGVTSKETRAEREGPSPSSSVSWPSSGSLASEGGRVEEGVWSGEVGRELPRWITRASATGPPFASEKSR